MSKTEGNRCLAELLADKHAIGPLLEFLKNTKVRSREGMVEKELEWEQRKDWEGEDELGNLQPFHII